MAIDIMGECDHINCNVAPAEENKVMNAISLLKEEAFQALCIISKQHFSYRWVGKPIAEGWKEGFTLTLHCKFMLKAILYWC